MRQKCDSEGCNAPKSLCKILLSPNYQECQNWIDSNKELASSGSAKISADQNTVIPWSGMELTPDKLDLISHRSTPLIIGIIGAANAGKTSYLGMLYTLLFNGHKFTKWNFAGSYTLIAWEAQAKGLKIGSNGKVSFPAATPSTPDYYSLYHMALKADESLHDIVFADSSGEVFTKWADDTEDIESDNAKWIYENSDGFIFFVDCEAIIKERGRAKRKITQLAGQIASNLGNRYVAIAWSKSDKIDDIPPTIKEAIEQSLAESFPLAKTFYISNFSVDSKDERCFVNNLALAQDVLEAMTKTKQIYLIPTLPMSNDFFINYHGRNYSKR
ncbi:hypothetical protein SAMN05444397_102294 [Flavobacterium aquidurense]|uniref:Double-GTPase 2 domain-containing protein n=1 Tax=Flavobacterium frigidimaris TaxID=262320 RepID=A0ABX4BQL6_FLAFR|nr:hypothetical protein [Flavobacterium frigidimaris]OXA79058.1 hypothetical protein B0A65_10945 [Flavobacterium frigidimaris]SDY80390.1 hypothetical protein SAMN05444397_102294 [Flavobacterium aquidurense]